MKNDTRTGGAFFETKQGLYKLYWNQKETAWRLGISTRTLLELRDKHPFYAPDSFRNTDDEHKKMMPLWSEELIQLIARARCLTAQGVRMLNDDEGLTAR